MTRLLAILLALLACAGCGTAGLGDKSWQTATLCTTDELAPIVQDATERWHAAAPQVRMRVEVKPQGSPGCDADVYETSDPEAIPGKEIANTYPGGIRVKTGVEWSVDASDVVTHEIGHLLLGPGHDPDAGSVMYYMRQDGEQDILARDVARL